MHLKEKTAGMDMHVGHNTTMKNMLVREIMFAVQRGVVTCRMLFWNFVRDQNLMKCDVFLLGTQVYAWKVGLI
ncbi:unnamed protein product [Ilex paraguariensis]|uniref:Uncharacterized protein n=1 Tax=Ilex paraguariensis TaxID=185542 RepID=A0ABC8R0M5_9AQUA